MEDKRRLLETLVLIVVIITLIVFIVKVQSDGAKCVSSPLRFAISDYSKANNSSMSCSCFFENMMLTPIFANRTGLFNTPAVTNINQIGLKLP